MVLFCKLLTALVWIISNREKMRSTEEFDCEGICVLGVGRIFGFCATFCDTSYYLMRPNTRLDKTINGLAEIVKRHNLQDKYVVSKSAVILYNGTPQFWGTVAYIFIGILLPAAFAVYYFIVDRTNSLTFLLPLVVLTLSYQLYKMVRGNTVLTIDFIQKIFRTEHVNSVFKHWFENKTIAFSDLTNVELKNKFVSSGKGHSTYWLQLIGIDKREQKIVLTDFSDKYPHDIIAKKIKLLAGVIIWTEKQTHSSYSVTK